MWIDFSRHKIHHTGGRCEETQKITAAINIVAAEQLETSLCCIRKLLYTLALEGSVNDKSWGGKHTAFHVEAGKVANLINAHKYQDAEAALGMGSRYMAASSDVGQAVIRLRKETGL